MNKRLLVSIAICVMLGGSLLLAVTLAGARPAPELKPVRQPSGRTITVTPWGPSQEAVDAAKAGVMSHPAMEKYIKGARHRMLNFEFLESAAKGRINQETARRLPPATTVRSKPLPGA